MFKLILLKTILWRIFSIVVTFAIVYLFTDGFLISFGITLVDTIIKTIAYFIYEYLWNNKI